MIIAAVAVLVGVFYAATGRGGELAYEYADHAPLDLGPVSAADVAMLRPPTALWGYNMQVTDEALEAIARAVRDRDVMIAFLRQQLAGQGTAAGPAPETALTPPTTPQFLLESQTAPVSEAPEFPEPSPTTPAAEFPLPSRTVPAAQVPPAAGPEQPAGPKHARPRLPWSRQEPVTAEAPIADRPGPAAEVAEPAEPASAADSASAAAASEEPADSETLARAEEQGW